MPTLKDPEKCLLKQLLKFTMLKTKKTKNKKKKPIQENKNSAQPKGKNEEETDSYRTLRKKKSHTTILSLHRTFHQKLEKKINKIK